MNKRGAAGAFRSNNLRDRPARETLDQGIQGGNAAGEGLPKPSVGTDSERGGESGVRVHAISPFLRL